MNGWPDRRILDLFGIELPIIQAPMAGPVHSDMVIAVSEAGGLGSLPCALSSLDQVRNELRMIRQQTSKPINVNFFCHHPPEVDAAREAPGDSDSSDYYIELGMDPNGAHSKPPAARLSIPISCDLVAEFKPEVMSFHFGLPAKESTWIA